jgi:hypothetical protein
LLCVLFRLRQHSTAISRDIKAMFHQICLLPSDTTLLRFIWRNMECDAEPTIYKWQVLLFGTTCSHCCATLCKYTNGKPQTVTQKYGIQWKMLSMQD